MIISSVNNEKIKEIKKLNMKKYRNENKKYIIEGIKIIEEAYLSNQLFDNIVMCEQLYNSTNINKENITKLLNDNEDKIIYVTENVFQSMCDTVSPQGIIAVVCMKENNIEITDNNIVFLDGLQDLGNIGTIIRTASAFSFNTVILNENCVDIYNPKLIRSTMGNIFKINCLQLYDNGINILNDLKQKGYVIYETTLDNSEDVYSVKFNDKKILIMGNEANGISNEILQLSDENIVIPMDNNTESLNVSIATGIIMSEIRRKELYEYKK